MPGFLSQGRRHYNEARRITPQDSVSQLGYYGFTGSSGDSQVCDLPPVGLTSKSSTGARSRRNLDTLPRADIPGVRGKLVMSHTTNSNVSQVSSVCGQLLPVSSPGSRRNSNSAKSRLSRRRRARVRLVDNATKRTTESLRSQTGNSTSSCLLNESFTDKSEFFYLESRPPPGSIGLNDAATHRSSGSRYRSLQSYYDYEQELERQSNNKRKVYPMDDNQDDDGRSFRLDNTRQHSGLLKHQIDQQHQQRVARYKRRNGDRHNRRMMQLGFNSTDFLFNPYALSELFSQSEIPGFREIFASDSYLRKFCWIVAFMAMTILSLSDIMELVTEYMESPITVGLRLKDEARLPFPSVTVCNLNVVRFTALCSSNARYNLTNQIPSDVRDRLCGNQIELKNKTTISDITDINNIGLTTTSTTQRPTTTTTTGSSFPFTGATNLNGLSPQNPTTISLDSVTAATLISILNGTKNNPMIGGAGGTGSPTMRLPAGSGAGQAEWPTSSASLTSTSTSTTTSTKVNQIKPNGGLDLGDFKAPVASPSKTQESKRRGSGKPVKRPPPPPTGSLIKGPFSARQVTRRVGLAQTQTNRLTPSSVLGNNNNQAGAQKSISPALSRSPSIPWDRRNLPAGLVPPNQASNTSNLSNGPNGIPGNHGPHGNGSSKFQASQLPAPSPALEDFELTERKERELQQNLTDWLAVMYQRDPNLTLSLGHQFEDMILRCTMKFNNCTHHRSFQKTFSATEGNCFTYNSKIRNNRATNQQQQQQQQSGSRSSSSNAYFDEVNLAGTSQGLELVLNLEKNEYITGSSQVGAMIMIHHPNDLGYAASEAMFVPTELTTYIGLKMVNITRLPYPHPERCVDKWPRLFEDKMIRNSTYSQQACLKICLQKTIQSHCQCQSANLPILELNDAGQTNPDGAESHSNNQQQQQQQQDSSISSGDDSSALQMTGNKTSGNGGSGANRIIICDTRKQTTRQCVTEVTQRAAERVHNCQCPPKCQVVRYDKTVSMARWPTTEDKVTFDRAKMDINFKNLAKVIVYFQTMTCDEVTQHPVYNYAKFVSSIGGIMGMYVGFSFLSVFEIFEVISRKTWHHYRSKYNNQQVMRA